MVKQGYKQTEIGVIPEEWKIASLKDLSDGRFTYGVNAPAIPYAPPLPNYIRITDISDDGRFMRESRTSVDCQNPEMYTLKENDIVFARTGASTGKTYLYRKNDGDLVYAGFLIKASILPEKANSKYVFDNLHTNRYWDWVSVTSMRSGQPGINGNEYASYMIPCPSLPEQEHIAEALSDVDSMISSLEKLIAKKKAVKQGAMQELLTGRKRLPGFTGEWKPKMFRDVCFINAPMVDPAQKEYEYLPHIGNESIEKENGRISHYNLVKDDHLISGKYYFSETDVLYGKINPQFAKAAYPKFKGLCSADMYPISCGAELNPIYLLYILLSEEFTKYTVSLSNRSGIPKVNREELAEYLFKLPSIKEQTAIASVLSDIDNEIESLEQKLTKARQIKQGMMQQLLTGKVRLV